MCIAPTISSTLQEGVIQLVTNEKVSETQNPTSRVKFLFEEFDIEAICVELGSIKLIKKMSLSSMHHKERSHLHNVTDE